MFAIAALATMLAVILSGRTHHREYFGATRVPAPVKAEASLPRMDAGRRDADALASLLSSRPAFANDVAFLIVASIRARCEPAHAHELAAMASRARLPVLAGVTEAIGKDVERREALLEGIRNIATHAPCTGAFTMGVGSYAQRLDPATYAAAFPDSYFDAGLETIPEGFGGHSLAERADDDCYRVAYAVLPLDEPRAWQCTALRASARQRVLALCHQGGAAASATSRADDTAVQIRNMVGQLPPTCQ